jgi:hypothetical protein
VLHWIVVADTNPIEEVLKGTAANGWANRTRGEGSSE